jgi:hypothetical protein
MHRAGTSLTTALLRGMGITLGKDLIPGRDENPLGFFECASLVEAIKKLEDRIGRRPFRPAGLLDFPEGWTEQPYTKETQAVLTERLDREIEQAGDRPFGFKDPRTARFLPLWRKIFEDLDLRPRYVLALRDPVAVARSNIDRTKHSPAEAYLLWTWHYVDAVRHTNGRIDCVLEYERWFSEPQAQAEMAVECLNLQNWYDPAAFQKASQDLVQSSLSHWSSYSKALPRVLSKLLGWREDESIGGGDIASENLPQFVIDLYKALKVIANSPEQALALVAQFLSMQALFAPWAVASETEAVLLDHLVDSNRYAGRLEVNLQRLKTRHRRQLERETAELRTRLTEAETLRAQAENAARTTEARLREAALHQIGYSEGAKSRARKRAERLADVGSIQHVLKETK